MRFRSSISHILQYVKTVHSVSKISEKKRDSRGWMEGQLHAIDISKVRYFDISKLSTRYPTLALNRTINVAYPAKMSRGASLSRGLVMSIERESNSTQYRYTKNRTDSMSIIDASTLLVQYISIKQYWGGHGMEGKTPSAPYIAI